MVIDLSLKLRPWIVDIYFWLCVNFKFFNETGDSNGETQLHKAVKDGINWIQAIFVQIINNSFVVIWGDVTSVNSLIKSGSNVNAIDEHKNTPLHLIGGINDSDNQHVIAELLVNAGADVNAKNIFDKTPLDLANTNTSKQISLNKNYGICIFQRIIIYFLINYFT